MSEMTDSAFNDAVYKKLCLKKYSNIISGLKPKSIYSVDIENDDFIDFFMTKPTTFKDCIKFGIFRILEEQYGSATNIIETFGDIKILLVGKDTVEMHDINSKYENVVITFDCVISATDSPKTYVKRGVARCSLCGNEEVVSCDFEKKIHLSACSNQTCRKNKMELRADKIVTDDVQTVLLQEPLERARHSSPVILTGKLYGKDVSNAFVGQKKRIIGVFRSIIEKTNDENDVYIDILSINNLEEEEDLKPSQEEEIVFREESKKSEYITKIISSFAPNIYGMSSVKLAILLQLVGGVKGNKRSDINIFLVGDPSMAKSEMLKYAKRITKKSIYTSGRGATAAGLTIGIIKLADGRMVAAAGILPLCNNGYAFIDEFDKMNKDDRSAMHEAMEQQTVSIAKAGISLTLPTRTSILAAANPKFGSYDSSLTLRENIDIPAPLLTRFDLIFLIKDTVNTTEDMMKASHIIDSFEDSIKHEQKSYYDEKSLISLLSLARIQNPKLSIEVKNEIINIYNNMRSLSKPDELPVGTRQLEALVRLSYALAKLKLKDYVELQDVIEVKNLIEFQYNTFNLSISSGNRQTVMGGTNMQSEQHVAEQVWKACENEDGNVNVITFMRRLVESGFEPMKAKRLFNKWEEHVQIKLNTDGTYKKLQ